jgi:hypothetical protein
MGDVEEKCLIQGAGECRGSHRCYDCWCRSGCKTKDQLYVDALESTKWSTRLQPFVEDGISMLGVLLAEKESKMSGFTVRARTTDWSPLTEKHKQAPTPPPVFDNGTFALRTYMDAPYGEWMFKISDFEVTWYHHLNHGGFQSRQMKGMEWVRLMKAAIASLGA